MAHGALAGPVILAAATAVVMRSAAARRYGGASGTDASRMKVRASPVATSETILVAKSESSESLNRPATKKKRNPVAVFQTSRGTFKAEILLSQMPITASNFIDLAQTGFYNGLHFHRVLTDSLAQVGCPWSRDLADPNVGKGGPDEGSYFEMLHGPNKGRQTRRFKNGNIHDEFTRRFSNVPGTLAMANTGTPNSGGSQFFINVRKNDYLDWFNSETECQYPVFGRVVTGAKVVRSIAGSRTRNDRPLVPIKLIRVTLEGLAQSSNALGT